MSGQLWTCPPPGGSTFPRVAPSAGSDWDGRGAGGLGGVRGPCGLPGTQGPQQEVLVSLSGVGEGDTVVGLNVISSSKQGKLLSPWLGPTLRSTVMESLAGSQH